MRYLSNIPADIAAKARQEALKDYDKALGEDPDFLVIPDADEDDLLWPQGTPEDQ
jgi:hypothetical protein